MTSTREDPRPLLPLMGSAALRTVFFSVLTAAVYWAVTSYADDVVRVLLQLGLRGRQIEPWRLPAMVVLVAVPAWQALSAASELIRVAVRFRTARAWERQLDDPLRAADVPPLDTHLIARTRTTVKAAAGVVAGSVLLTLGAAGFAAAGTSGVLPFRPSDDAIGYGWVVAVAALWAIVRSLKALGNARRAATVERLSSSGPMESEQQAGTQAHQVPQLTVRFAQALRPDPTSSTGARILYLRLFDNLAGTERFVSRWRGYGVVHYLRSADQVSAAELKSWSGQVGDLSVFIDNDAELDEVLSASRPEPGPGGYPAGELLCHGSYWKRAVLRLLQAVDFVVLDLTGFHTGHGGTAFEVRSAIDLVAIDRLKLTAALDSDRRFLAAQLQRAWSEMAADSPNAGGGARTLTVHLG